jgi:diketogulonate reductase-like aldo/keto reductase
VDLVDAKPEENDMQAVTLGATQLEVTPIAYGTWQFGGDWGPVDERAAIAAIGRARSLGINFFDAADLRLSQADLAEIDRIMAAAVPVGGPSPEGMA